MLQYLLTPIVPAGASALPADDGGHAVHHGAVLAALREGLDAVLVDLEKHGERVKKTRLDPIQYQ